MATPKKIKYDININQPKIGTEFLNYGDERIKTLLKSTDQRTKYIPKGVTIEDLDISIYDLVNDGNLSIIIDGEKVPCFYLDDERWGELSKTWKFYDDDKNVKLPYVIIRKTGKKRGTRLNKTYNTPNQRKYPYINVPIMDNGQLIYLSFKVPEPSNIDLNYSISLFSKYRIDINQFDEHYFTKFDGAQVYVFPKDNPMPIQLESSSEPKTLENNDGEKFIISEQNIVLKGFILNENDIEIVKTYRKPNFGYIVD